MYTKNKHEQLNKQTKTQNVKSCVKFPNLTYLAAEAFGIYKRTYVPRRFGESIFILECSTYRIVRYFFFSDSTQLIHGVGIAPGILKLLVFADEDSEFCDTGIPFLRI